MTRHTDTNDEKTKENSMEDRDCCAVQKQSLSGRIVRWLGYGECSQPNFVGDPYADRYAEDSLQSVVFIHFDFLDRLRLLITGNAIVRTSIKTDVVITRSYAKTNISIGTVSYRP